jgi:hypothetical protein
VNKIRRKIQLFPNIIKKNIELILRGIRRETELLSKRKRKNRVAREGDNKRA